MIDVDGISKHYGDVTAADTVSFSASDAAITTLLGANGSGKTTTLRSISGLIRPDGGAVRIDGIEVGRDPVGARRRLGVFPDSFGLYDRLTTREHLAYYAQFHGLSGKALDTAIDEIVSVLDIEDIIDRRTLGFSSGQRMKVALGRALIHKPQNLILDEPTRGLDVMSIRHLRETLRKLRDAGCTVLLSSHVMAEVAELSDRVVCLSSGRVVADDMPAALVERTGAANLEDAFVAVAA